MKESEILMLIVIYVLMAILSYRPFKKMHENRVLEMPLIASFFWPAIWILTTIIAIIGGYKLLLGNEE